MASTVTDRSFHSHASNPGDQRRIYVPPPPSGQPAPAPRSRPAPQRPSPDAPQRERPPSSPPGGLPPERRHAPRGPGGPGQRPGERTGPPWKKILLITVAVIVVILLLMFIWLNVMFGRIERVEVSPAFSSGSGTNYLIVGVDTDEDDPSRPEGARTDTMMVLHFGSDGTKMLSVPRDLWVTFPHNGDTGRINSAYNEDAGGGPQELVETVSQELDIPINRYMEVDFNSFGSLVDGMGGITIDFPHPASDPKSGLWVEGRGPQRLDGEQALAYVRSRTYTEHIEPGVTQVDPRGDIGRMERQQKFLSAVFSEVGSTNNPFTLMSTFSSVTGGLRIDDKMSLIDALRLGWRLRGLSMDPDSLVVLPTDPVDRGGAAVLDLQQPAADEALEVLR